MNNRPDLRKKNIHERREILMSRLSTTEEESILLHSLNHFDDLADILIENAIGFTPLPLGIVPSFLLNNKEYTIPLSTEEPSVIAALSHASRILSRAGGISARGAQPLTKGQVLIETNDPASADLVNDHLEELESILLERLHSMTLRGGGFRGWEIRYHPEIRTLEAGFWIDTRDSMGANLVNTLAESLVSPLEKICSGKKILAVLSNTGTKRVATAEFSLPLDRSLGLGSEPLEYATRIVRAADLAWHIPDRAVTHNKGIMNGITALALATGNDSRALEAAVHAYAARDGQYRSLSSYTIEDKQLKGNISLPLPLATVGGCIDIHPSYSLALKILGSPGSEELTALAAGVGLAQNFAALLALSGPGIQKGHMKLQARRVAWQAGARGDEVPELLRLMNDNQAYSPIKCRELLKQIRGGQ